MEPGLPPIAEELDVRYDLEYRGADRFYPWSCEVMRLHRIRWWWLRIDIARSQHFAFGQTEVEALQMAREWVTDHLAELSKMVRR